MNFQLVLTKNSKSLEPIINHTLTVHPIFARADPLADATAPRISEVGYSARVSVMSSIIKEMYQNRVTNQD